MTDDTAIWRQANARLHSAYHELRSALIEIASTGDGYGARNQKSGTTGEGHARCLVAADEALGIGFDDLPASADDASQFWSDLKRESVTVEP